MGPIKAVVLHVLPLAYAESMSDSLYAIFVHEAGPCMFDASCQPRLWAQGFA